MKKSKIITIGLHIAALLWLYFRGFLPDILAELAKDLQTLASLI